MMMVPNPTYAEDVAREYRERTMRAAEEYELQRAFRELDRQRRERRRTARTVRKMARAERRHEIVRLFRPTRGRA